MSFASSLRRHGLSDTGTGFRILATALLTAALVLPLLDSHALEGDPYHDHIVVGGSPADQARALAQHFRHRTEPPDLNAPAPSATRVNADPNRSRARVLSVGSVGGSSVIGLANAVAVTPGRPVVPILLPAGPVVIPPLANPLDAIVAVPDPPPRGS